MPDRGRPSRRLPRRRAGATSFTRDYRVRAIAGLGVEAAIVNQEFLAREAGRLAGAYEEAADRLRRLRSGCWRRGRCGNGACRPTRSARLALLGPAYATC